MTKRKKFLNFLKNSNTFIIAAIAVLICIGTIIASVIYTRNMKNSLWSQMARDITEVTTQGGHAFEMYVQKECDSIETLSKNLERYDFSKETGDFSREEALRLFDMYSNEDGYFTLAILDEEGEREDGVRSIAYLSDGKLQTSITDREVMTYTTDVFEGYDKRVGKGGITEPYENYYTHRQTLGYYKCFAFKDGTKALVRKGQELSYIVKEFSLSFYENSGFSYIVDKKGDIIVRSTHKNSIQTYTNIFKILETQNEDDENIRTLKEHMSNFQSGAILSETGDEDNVISFVPLFHSANTKVSEDWYIISIIPNRVIQENIDSVIKSSLSITIVVVAVTIIFALFVVTMFLFRKAVAKKTAEVKYREQLFGILAKNTNDVFLMTPHGKFEAEYISPNINRVMGLDESEVKADLHTIGMPDNLENDEHYRGLIAVSELAEGETASYNSMRTHKITGENKYFHETAYHVSIDGVDKDIIVFSDRTVERQTEAKLTEAMEAAQAASTAKSAFLSSMSHDIRTPMNAIIGMTSIAVKHIDDKDRVSDCLNKITMSSNHLLTLINDVLDISKIESGRLNLSPIVFSLRDTITNLVNIVRPQVTEKNLSFEIHTNGVAYEYLYADMLRINQVFINILSNAVKYTPKGGKVVMDLTEQVLEQDKLVRLKYVVSDTGIGMSPEYMKTMYDTFSRAEDSRTNTIQGTGLGLAIVKQLINLMGGTIECESEINKGTTFTVCIDVPVGSVRKQDLKLPPIHMLVVDDDSIFLEGVKEVVNELGASADTALSGQEAIDMVKNNTNYSVVIVDWKMPGLSGLETIREIRKIIPKDTPIILVSAYDWDDVESEAKHCGVDGFISKPLFRSYIYEKLCNVLKLNETKTDKKKYENAGEDLSGLNVLIAEDNDLNWEVISVLLDMYGIKATRAANGQICVDTIESSKPDSYDLILMDVQMPIMNGKDATRAIRKSKNDYVKNIPIIAMTADAFAEDIASCLESGMDGHVSKPVDMDKLCQEIKRILSERKN